MLAGALFYVALIALIATTILSAGLAMTRMATAQMARPYLAAGYQRAVDALQQQIAVDVQTGISLHPAPALTPLPPACANAECTYTTSARIALTETVSPTAGPSCDPQQSNCASNVQINGYVKENRITALVAVQVEDRNGAVIARRSQDVVLRTLATPPYAAIAGSREDAFDDVVDAHAQGDDGGAPAATPNPCASTAAGTADDTTVRVLYRNAATNACSNGSAWGNASYSVSE